MLDHSKVVKQMYACFILSYLSEKEKTTKSLDCTVVKTVKIPLKPPCGDIDAVFHLDIISCSLLSLSLFSS